MPDGRWRLRITKSIMKDFSCPQFSVNVSSYSRKVMQDIVYKAVDNDIPIYYSNTDCLCLREQDVLKLAMLTSSRFLSHDHDPQDILLGDFIREYPETTRKFICLSPKIYIHCFRDDGQDKLWEKRYGPRDKNKDPEEYFEELYDAKLSPPDSQ
jgi:hypothetical protein